MAFTRPTLAEIVDRVQVDFVSRLSLVGAVLRRSLVYVLSRVVAGASHMLHGHLEYLGKQLFPDLSDDAYLVRQASLYGLTKTAATYATATVTATGTNGVTIPQDTYLVRSDGARYLVDADVTISGGTATLAVTAELAGADYTLEAAVSLSLESPISGVDSTTTVAASTADGNDQEETESLRTRLLERMSEPANGGTEADYIAWAKEVSGVTRVWVSPLELGPGTVVVRFARDNDASPIPDAGEVTAVQTKLDDEAPVHATVTAFAPTDSPQNFTITVVPDTSAVRAAVEAELEALILREGEPGGTLLLSAMRTAIGTSSGVTDYTLTSPAADVTYAANALPSLGTITWV